MNVHILIIFLLIALNGHSQTLRQDSTVFNDQANKIITSSIETSKPILKISIFSEGKKIKKNYAILLNSESRRIILKPHRYNLSKEIIEFDSVYFDINYHDLKVSSHKIPIKILRNGGELIAGFVKDYTEEKYKYNLDSNLYFKNNQENFLYFIMYRFRMWDSVYLNKKYELHYFLIKNNRNDAINFKCEFLRKKDNGELEVYSN